MKNKKQNVYESYIKLHPIMSLMLFLLFMVAVSLMIINPEVSTKKVAWSFIVSISWMIPAFTFVYIANLEADH